MAEDPALAPAVALIAQYEGFSAEPYQDIDRVWTVGFGFTYLGDGSRVTAATPPMTRGAATERLGVLAAATLASVRGMVHRPLNASQAAAWTSFAYNEGTYALRMSTMLKMWEEGEAEEDVAQQFMAWTYAGGVSSEGLRNRRAAERALFLYGSKTAPPVPEEDEADLLDDEYNPSA